MIFSLIMSFLGLLSSALDNKPGYCTSAAAHHTHYIFVRRDARGFRGGSLVVGRLIRVRHPNPEGLHFISPNKSLPAITSTSAQHR
ncbi:MAG: hypothetical protein L0H37_08375, partial [Nitrosospira sp.]|nr:hypothetical protein [Nitrosospira sp.]